VDVGVTEPRGLDLHEDLPVIRQGDRPVLDDKRLFERPHDSSLHDDLLSV
jgi:hypothetical protein